MFETVLLPLNFHEPMWRLRSLVRFLRNFGTRRILLVHVVSSGLEAGGRVRGRLDKVREGLGADSFEIECIVRSGSPALEVVRTASERDAQFVSIPWKKKDFLQRTLLGSVTEDVVRLSDLPVFVYKTWADDGPPDSLANILYATTFDPTHERIIDYLRYEHLNARTLHVLNVGERAPDPEAERKRREGVFAELKRFKSQCGGCFDTVKSITTVGTPKREILRAARRVGANLIVMGKHGAGKPLENLLGSTAETLTHRAKCSVFIVPAGE